MSGGEKIAWTAGGDRKGQNDYGTFQGVANYYTPLPPCEQAVDPAIIGFHLLVPPPGSSVVPPPYNPFAYQAAAGYVGVQQGYPVVEVLQVRERRLPCCGMGVGWFLFFIGFFLGGIPWYIAASLLICARLDRREKPGYIAVYAYHHSYYHEGEAWTSPLVALIRTALVCLTRIDLNRRLRNL